MPETDSAPLLDVISRAETLEETFASMPMAVVVVDLEARVVLWSGLAESMYGYRASEAVGRPIRDLILAPGAGPLADEIRTKLDQGERWTGRFPVVRKDGSTFEAFVMDAPVHAADGRLVGTVGLSIDIADAEVSRADRANQEARFRGIVDTTRDGIWVIDRAGTTTFANQQMADILRCSLEDLDGRSVFDHVPDEDLAEAVAILERLRAGLPQRFDFRLTRADGSLVQIDVTTTPLLGLAGDVIGALGTVTDVTQEREAMEALRLSEERFRRVFEDSPLGGVVIDRRLRIQRANAAFGRMLGYEPEDLLGCSVLELTHPDDLELGRDEVVELFRGDRDHLRLDKRYLRSDGEVVVARVTVAGLRDPDGEMQAGIAQIEDVTEAERAQRTIAEQREHLDMALDAAGLAAWELDLTTGRYTMTDNLEAVYGTRAVETVTFADFIELVVPEDRHLFLQGPEGSDLSFRIDFRIQREDGPAWLRSRGEYITDEDGTVVAVRGTSVDISESVRAAEERAEADAVHRTTLEALLDAFVGTDGVGRITDWNPAAESMFGWSRDEVLGELLVERIFQREDRGRYQERIETFSALGSRDVVPGRIELIVQHRLGHTFPVELSLIVVDVGGQPQLQAFLRDITARRAYERDLTDRALVDQLTGLPNRILLADRLGRAIYRVGSRNVHAAVLFLDVDRMEAVNESLGHAAGDALLVAAADRLRSTVGIEHTVARHGGDEFIVLCEDLPSPDVALRVAASIEAAFAQPLAVAGRRLTIGWSIGVAAVSSGDVSPDEAIRDADLAMHQAKSLGGRRIEVLEAAHDRAVTGRLDLEQELRQALIDGQISVAYQPVVTMDGAMVSMEALARWKHPIRGTITPAEFIPLAEETGLIVTLGAQVLQQACAQLAQWRSDPRWATLMVAVNLSGRQLVEQDFVAVVDRLLRVHDLPPGALCLEMTESMLMDETSTAAATVDELAELGIGLSVDDFGTGYSSLLYLRRFPVHALKLDRSFVAGIGTNDVDTAIIGSMIDLAHSLDLVAVAEGVETAEQAAALAARGCDLAQGWHYSKAVPAPQLTALLDDPRFAPKG